MTRRGGQGVAAALVAAALGLAGCAENPATGHETLNLLSPAEEQQIGREQHPQVVEAFGGAYQDSALQAYVEKVGRTLVAQSELAGQSFTFTVLDSDIVNAMALPGGYVYVTRGLLALANDEAELAGVMAHEIGHVTAQHTAQRVTQSTLANIGLTVLGAVVGNPGLANAAGVGAQALLQKYSRDQEFEADTLGIRYMARAGYDPAASATFLDSLGRQAALEAQLAGRSADGAAKFNMMATHPRTTERVQRATEAAAVMAGGHGRLDRDAYLRQVDGMLYGDDPAEGVVRGHTFLHPRMQFSFTVPDGFRLVNGRDKVTAMHPRGATILFDGGRYPGGDILAYLRTGARNLQLAETESLTIDGMPAATGATRVNTDQGVVDLRLVVIRFDERTAYRFMFLTPQDQTAGWGDALRRVTYSFRRLPPDEAARVRPYRIDLIQVRPDDSIASLAAALPFDTLQEERFTTLNGLRPGEPLQPGQMLKTVVE